jgi:Rrf2 family nitric oxide-sensitive transcriptional repressor
MRLHMPPDKINIGILVRETEQDLNVVECFSSKNRCGITPVCGLRSMFGEALNAFLSVLDKYTLADVIDDGHQSQVLRLLQIA